MMRVAMKQSDTATILYGFKFGEGTREERVRRLTDCLCNSFSIHARVGDRHFLETVEDAILRFTEAEILEERRRIKEGIA
jgi:hypothetical protein